MAFNKNLLLTFFVLCCMLLLLWWPSFSTLGDLFGYAEKAEYKGVSLLDFFKAELLVLVTVWGFLISYKQNRVDDGDRLVVKHIILMVFIIGQVFMGFFAGGFLVHQDVSWYQVVHESSEVMPSQAVILLICYPLYLFFGGGAYLYAKTRLPAFLRNKQVAFLVLAFAPLAFLPHYNTDMMVFNSIVAEFAYLAAYWLLSICWAVFGVMFLIIKSTQEIFKGLSDPFGDM
ncbi:MAG: hypothetical protein A6F72_04220 [Cycloclasticus sp. symbiont of Poecilosclerida sp. N]|nr:MAG: hypothetical protein A6F72_04220 [Cycloclasticus sp. symbiont of Poecilosclerida sp. N]